MHQLMGEHYVIGDRSSAFPILGTDDLQNFLELKHQVEENALIRQLREWVISRSG